jgi:hypothetical protein
VYYKYEQRVMSQQSWIKYIQKVTNLNVTAIGNFDIKEVHYTMPKTPGDTASAFATLPHLTIEAPNGKKIHWYVWKKKLSDQRRIEEMMKQKIKTDSLNPGEKALVDKVMADVVQSNWF